MPHYRLAGVLAQIRQRSTLANRRQSLQVAIGDLLAYLSTLRHVDDAFAKGQHLFFAVLITFLGPFHAKTIDL